MKKITSINNIFALLILLLSCCVASSSYQTYKYNNILANKNLNNTINLIKNQLADKLFIVANSKIFMHFIRSGEISRQSLITNFQYEITKFYDSIISGFEIYNKENRLIFQGSKTKNFLTLELCYLDENLDLKFGICDYIWKIYLNSNALLSRLKGIEKDIFIANNIDMFASNYLGNFKIIDHNHFYVSIKNSNTLNSGFLIAIFSIIFLLIYLIYNYIRIQQQIKADLITQVAHDLKNPLATLNLLKEHIIFNDDKLDKIFNKTVDYLVKISQNILLLNKDKYNIICFNSTIINILENNELLLVTNNITIIKKFTNTELFIKIDQEVLQRAFNNFIENSIFAINKKNGSRKIKVSLSKLNNNAVLRIIDSGCGFAPNNLRKIFHNKFSTKIDGSGLGIYTSYRNLKKFGVKINIYSHKDIATMVKIHIPLVL